MLKTNVLITNSSILIDVFISLLPTAYCCLSNMKQIIQSHNRRLLRNDSTVDDWKCLKKNKHNCPLLGKCSTENVIYKATVTLDNCVKTYIRSGQSLKRCGTGTAFYLELTSQNASPVNLYAKVLVLVIIAVKVSYFSTMICIFNIPQL